MDRLDAIRLFIRTVENGSFSAVAREAGVGQPAVSKQIAALEAHLGAQFMRRTSRSMTLTDAGQGFYEAAVRLIEDFDEIRSSIGQEQAALSGLVRVTAAPVFGRLYITPKLPDFFAAYPGISVELSATDRTVNLVEEGVDLAIRMGDLTDSSMTARRLASTPIVTLATPAYLDARGAPATPDDLQQHSCVVFNVRQEPRLWTFTKEGQTSFHHPAGRFRTADPEQLRTAVLAHLGLTQAPRYLFADAILAGTAQVVLEDYVQGTLAISAVHPAGRRLPTRTRAFIEFLADGFTNDPAFARA